MAWSTDPQEPERIPRAGWYATPTVLQPPAWAEWYDPYQERAGNDSGVGTLTATVKQIERVTANFGGAGAFTPGASSTTQYVAAAFDNYDTSATGYLYSGLSAWGWAVRTVAAALSGLGTTWVTTGDHVDGLSATTAEQYLGQPGIAQPSIGTLIGSVFQKYPAAGSFSSSSALSGEVHTLGGFPDGLSAYAFPESDVIGFEDSEGQLDGVIYQIYTGVAPPFASQGALTASVVPRRDSTPALTGFGILTLTTVMQMVRTAALSNIGTLSGTTTSQYNASVALTGSGALAATYTSQYYAQTAASLTGSGTLSATAVAQYLTNPSFGGGGTLSATAVDNWTPYNEENVAVTGGTVPSGASGCYVTIIGGGGGGGKANAKSTSPYTDYGGGGGGGGGKVARVWIPKASLGATYTVEVGGGGAGGFTPANGTRSYFTSGSVTLTANGGTKGANATTSAAGSAGGGGTASASGVTATTYNGASGSNGSSGTAIAGSASANAGAGGGGGGGGTNTLYFSGGAGGSANGGAIAGGTANGGTPSDAAAGIGGAGGGGGGTNGNGLGGNGGKYGGGAGGGGHGTTGRGGTGGAGYTKVEWV